MNLNMNILAAVAGLGLLASTHVARAEHQGGGYLGSLINQLQNAYDEDDREDAAEDLGKLGDRAALPALQEAALRDRDDDVREEAREAIERINRPRVIYRTSTVYVQPAPVYVQPAPVFVQPAPVYVQPAPVVYVQPAPVVYRTSVIRRSYRGHRGYYSHRRHGRSLHISFSRHY